MYGEHTLSANIEFDKDEWDIEEADYREEFEEAVETVRADHDAEVTIDADSLYKIHVRWNNRTDEIRFDVYGLAETFILREETHD